MDSCLLAQDVGEVCRRDPLEAAASDRVGADHHVGHTTFPVEADDQFDEAVNGASVLCHPAAMADLFAPDAACLSHEGE